jgi:Coenzyme PQQ synthesis protein D (PqqD)
MPKTRPQARNDDLLIEELEDELLVYDQRDDSAHRLNRTAAIVWRHCDGTRDIDGLVAALERELGEVADEDLVRIALDDLADRELITGAPERPPEDRRLSRRRFIRRVGTVGAAALSLPVVTSLVAPEPAAAQSACQTCATSSSCFSSCTCAN